MIVSMRVVLLLGALLAPFAASLAQDSAAAADGIWRPVSAGQPRPSNDSIPVQAPLFALDRSSLDSILARAPREGTVRVRNSPAVIALPLGDGSLARYAIVESPIMAPELAAKFPEITTWLGQGIDDPTATVRFDLSPRGLHAQILSGSGTFYIDPAFQGDAAHHVAYARRDLGARPREFVCSTVDEPHHDALHGLQSVSTPRPFVSTGETLRTFRLAMGATGEYTTVHGGTVAGALAGMVTSMNRINGIFERDLAVRMVLVANNELIIYTDGATDPYTNSSGSAMLGENQSTIDARIGNANYDIGHVFSTGGGGVVSGRVCTNSSKARGVTGSSQPVADAFDVDYVAHEMGHQFAGPHTYNSVNCSASQRVATSAYETGSGATIMAYAGICGVENLQPNSDDYFHRDSLNRILGFVDGLSCDVETATGNAAPTITAPATASIPARTPFALSAIGVDTNGDALTYVWEQFDLGASTSGGAALVDDGTRPIFRPDVPTGSPTRQFPELRFQRANANLPPAQVPLPGTTTPNRYTGDTLPTTARALNFRVTARDNRAGGGGTNEASLLLLVDAVSGPFAVTAPNTIGITWSAGSSQAVMWNVAGTSAVPISTADVRITLSTDDGRSFPIVLLASTPNDGTEDITVPANLSSAQARVRVEAVGNYYFDMSDNPVTVTSSGGTPPSITVTDTVTTRQGSPMASGDVATISDADDAAASLTVAVSGAPDELGVAVVNNAGTVRLTATAQCSLVTPTAGNRVFPVVLTVTDPDADSTSTSVNVNVGANQNPVPGVYSNAVINAAAAAMLTPAIAPSDPNGNLTSMAITPNTLAGGGTLSVAPNGVVSVTTTAGTALGTRSFRIAAIDSCGATRFATFDLRVRAAGTLFEDSFEEL